MHVFVFCTKVWRHLCEHLFPFTDKNAFEKRYLTRGYLGNVHVKGLCFCETRGSGELDGGQTNTGGHEDFTQLQAPGG